MDAQTLMGKTPAGVAELAKKQGKAVHAFAGCFGDGIEMCKNSPLFDACYSVTEYLEAGQNRQESQNKQALTAEELAPRFSEKLVALPIPSRREIAVQVVESGNAMFVAAFPSMPTP